MWVKGWREKAWKNLESEWDMIIIGGGITGAGIFRMAAKAGIRVLLLEKNDFAFGTSSRSSKLIHGGLRYLRNYQFNVTYESVNQREKLLRDAKYLVNPILFLLPIYESYHTSSKKIKFSLFLYDLFGKKKAHGEISANEITQQNPLLSKSGLIKSFYYFDAVVDDARLVLRNIQEGTFVGGTALNYINVIKLIPSERNKIIGVVARQNMDGNKEEKKLFSRVIINATGPWTDEIRKQVSSRKIIRKLRGSHIQFSQNRLPIDQALSIFHPKDGRSLFVIPWAGITLVGTTDLDHNPDYEKKHPEPYMSSAEECYLLEAVNHYFPEINLSHKDIISSFSGLRPIVSSGGNDPSKESRKEVILEEQGLFTITGGKLTTYGEMAYKLLRAVRANMPNTTLQFNKNIKLLDLPPNKIQNSYLSSERINKFKGKFGKLTQNFLDFSKPEELELIKRTGFCLAELRWAAKYESVCHLDDLLLRRSRLGLLLPNGGLGMEKEVRKTIQTELGWDDQRWERELSRYRKIWVGCYFSQKVEEEG